MHLLNSRCTLKQVCFDNESFPLKVGYENVFIVVDYYKLGWLTELYVFHDDSSEEETENDFMFELILN
jgi:hypothetical protein